MSAARPLHSAPSSRSAPPARGDTEARPGRGTSPPGNQQMLRALGLQPKLALSEPGDALEQEADRVAGEMSAQAPSGLIQRQCASCEDEEVQRKAEAGAGGEAPRGFEAAARARGGGEPLPRALRSELEPRIGTDLRDVRVHTDARADASARSIGALAYTMGNDVVFRAGQYDPRSSPGRRLLAHELTHVRQQRGGTRTVQRESDRDEEIARSRVSPGRVAGTPVPPGVSLYNFGINQSELKPTHMAALDELARLANAGAIWDISVSGHADSTGEAPVNDPLSYDRAIAVADYLANANVLVGVVTGHGETQPVADNASEAGRNRNRRVDIVFTVADVPPPEVIVPPEPGGPEPPGEEDGPEEFWSLCDEFPYLCAAIGPSIVVLFCVLKPEICALIWPGWPDWPDWPDDDDEPPEEEPEHLPCGHPRMPLTQVDHVPAGTDRGVRVEARPLTRCEGNTHGSPAKRDDPNWPRGWECVAGTPGQSDFWVRAHLLHDELHGPGNERWNIIISDKSINGLMYRRVERHAVNRVWDNDEVLWYETQVNHFTGSYPRPYFAESVDMSFGTMDPVTGVESPAIITEHIVSGVGLVPPTCSSQGPGPGPGPATPPPQPQWAGPTIGPAAEDAELRRIPMPPDLECGELSCTALERYSETVGHFRGDTWIVTADEILIREMIALERRFLELTQYAPHYQMLQGEFHRHGIEGPMQYQGRRALLDAEVETAARRRVFTFLFRHDPTFPVTGGTVEDAVRSDHAR